MFDIQGIFKFFTESGINISGITKMISGKASIDEKKSIIQSVLHKIHPIQNQGIEGLQKKYGKRVQLAIELKKDKAGEIISTVAINTHEPDGTLKTQELIHFEMLGHYVMDVLAEASTPEAEEVTEDNTNNDAK